MSAQKLPSLAPPDERLLQVDYAGRPCRPSLDRAAPTSHRHQLKRWLLLELVSYPPADGDDLEDLTRKLEEPGREVQAAWTSWSATGEMADRLTRVMDPEYIPIWLNRPIEALDKAAPGALFAHERVRIPCRVAVDHAVARPGRWRSARARRATFGCGAH
jgi:hypothetical protein